MKRSVSPFQPAPRNFENGPARGDGTPDDPSIRYAGFELVRFNLEEDLVAQMDTAVKALDLDSRLDLVRCALGEHLKRRRKAIVAYRRFRRAQR